MAYLRPALALLITLFGSASIVQVAEAPILRIEAGGHTATIRKVLFTPDGRQLISVGDDKVIRIWDVATGKTLRTLSGPIGPGPEGMLYAAALSLDGNVLAVGGYSPGDSRDIALFDLRTGQVTRLLKGHQSVITALAVAPNGKVLASGSEDRTARLWDMASGRPLGVLRGHTKGVQSIAFSPDGRRLVTAGDDRTVRIWTALEEDPKLVRSLSGHEASVQAVAWSPDGNSIASGSLDRSVRVWDAATGAVPTVFRTLNGAVVSLAFGPDGRALVIGYGRDANDAPGGKKGAVEQLSLPEGRLMRSYALQDNTVTSIAVSPDTRVIASAGEASRTITLWDSTSGAEIRRLVGKGSVLRVVAWAPDGTRIAWGENSLQHTFDLKNAVPGPDVTPGEMWRAAVVEQGGLRIASNEDRSGIVVHEGDREALRLRQGAPQISDRVLCFTFTPAGELVVGSESSLALYDANGRRLQEFVGHTAPIYGVACSPEGRYLASVSGDQTVRIWRRRGPGSEAHPFLSLFVGSDREWVAWTPEGYYTCSPAGDRLIGWQINRGADRAADYYPAYQFRRPFYRPDVFRRLFDAGTVAEAVRQADLERPVGKGANWKLSDLERITPPRVDILVPGAGDAVREPEVDVRARIVDANDRAIGPVTLRVNGRTSDMGAIAQTGSKEWHQRVRLEPGENQVSVTAVNDAGSEGSASITVRHTPQRSVVLPPPNRQPALYVLAIGISQYQGKLHSLRYASKDATDFAGIWRTQVGKLYSSVQSRLLTDARATKNEILDALDQMGKMIVDGDVVIVFVSGHGVLDERGLYYYLPYDYDLNGLKRTGVSWDDFRATLASLRAKVLLVLDTAHAGAGARDAAATVLRNAFRETGLVTLAASQPHEPSLESPEWLNGAFTRSLVEALAGQADSNRDGIVTLDETTFSVARRVAELTDGQQNPVVQQSGSVPRGFPLTSVGIRP